MFQYVVMSWPSNSRSSSQPPRPTASTSGLENTSGHRWCPINTDNKSSCSRSPFQRPLQENVIESSSSVTSTDLGAVSDTDSGLGVHEACDIVQVMPGPPTRGRKGGKETPKTTIDNPAWQVTPAEGAPAATTSSALPGAASRTDNAGSSGSGGGSGGSVLPSLRDPSHYEELSVIGNGKNVFTF
jgi:hypothetical protein